MRKGGKVSIGCEWRGGGRFSWKTEHELEQRGNLCQPVFFSGMKDRQWKKKQRGACSVAGMEVEKSISLRIPNGKMGSGWVLPYI